MSKNKPQKNADAQALGRRGGLARSAKLSPERRKAIAKMGGLARWRRKK